MAEIINKQLQKKPRRVVGLGYDPEHGIPQVLLKAAGSSAEEIIWNSQRSNGPPIVKNQAVLDALYRLPVDADIPADLFELIAIILVHVSAVDADIRNVPANSKRGTT
jgi:type III secretion system FlhB-like substrate exporter